MNLLKNILTLTLSGVTTLAIAQAPIVRQTPAPSAQSQPGTQYPAAAQYPVTANATAPSLMTPQQLDALVGRIALYPDPLLAQTLTASTFWSVIPDAATWAQQHSYLKGDRLSDAITADNLAWDPSVLALLAFPSVLDMMARDPNWTSQLGYAVLDQKPNVMNAVQRLRHQAKSYGYLVPSRYFDVIDNGGMIEIEPFDPYLYYLPVYDPVIVFHSPRPGFVVSTAITFGPVVPIGGSAVIRFGWFGAGFAWGSHEIMIDHRPWVRTFANRAVYAHPFGRPFVHPVEPRRESHDFRARR
jgi:hypothetical protein